MQATYLSQPVRQKSLTLIFSAIAGATLTFGIFVVMAALIKNDARPTSPPEFIPLGPIIMQKEEPKTIEKTKIKPQPKLTPPPSRPQQMEPNTVTSSNVVGPEYAYVPEKVSTGNDINMSPQDQDARPVVQVEPSYPVEAARHGIEGWVRLRFSIDEMGRVTDIDIMDAEPKRVFDREAKQALTRWKYQPKMMNGKPIRQSGLQVVLDFTLTQ